MRVMRIIPAVALVLLATACKDLTVPDFNNPSLEDLVTNPTPTKIAQASQGLLIGTRVGHGAQNGYVSLLGILGRESYNFDPADPRFITEMLIGPLDGGSPAFGGNLFEFPYRNIRTGNLILDALDGVTGMTDGEKSAVEGFTKTIQALDFLYVINTRDDLGAPIDVGGAPTEDPAPIVSRSEVFEHIIDLLDEGLADLNAGTDFIFALSEGFSEFDTPEAFIEFNRALKARVEVYRASLGDPNCGAGGVTCYQNALTALSQSFLDRSAPLSLGAYHSFSTGSGDTQNNLFDPEGRAILAHPSILTDAQTQPGGALDKRTSKVARLPKPVTVQDITTDLVFTIYPTNTSPVPIITNEELILLRAEARFFTGDQLGALDDINFIRQNAGGLAPRGPFTSTDDFITELLYNRRYSLLFTGGHRWIDARRFNRLGTLPKALSTHNVFSRFPFPEAECLARVPQPTQGCT